MDKIIVQKVNLQQNEVDRLNDTIEMMNNTIKYQQDKYLQLLKKLDNKDPFGLDNLLFAYDEIIEILKKQYHPLKNYLERWFGTYNDFLENEGLYFSEDLIELHENSYWLVNIKNDYACSLDSKDKLNRKIYELEKSEEDE